MSPSTMAFINRVEYLILNPIIGFMFAIAVLYFIYGIVEFILGAENEDKRETGKKHMIYGIIGMFVMVAVYGIMNLLGDFWVNIGSGY